MNRPVRLAGLDGVRAVSIVMVLLAHLPRTRGFPRIPALEPLFQFGAEGVTIFFVLSGFLITWLLLDEEQREGRIDIREFYVRRAFRILPAAMVYLLAMATASVCGWIQLAWRDLLIPAVFLANFLPVSAYTGHYWTLSTEEQFYLFWPALLRWWPRQWRLTLTASLVLLTPLWRQGNMAIHGASNVNWSRPDLRWDALLMGCVLALVWDNPRARDRLQALAGKHGWVLLLMGLGGLTFPWGIESATHGVTGMMGSTVKLTGICLLLLTAVTRAIRPLAALLDWRPVRWLGRISYSLYLWQQAFCFGTQGRWFESFPTNLALTFAAASLSYYLVEQPFLRLRGRILDSRSHSRIGTAVAPN